MRSGWPSRNTTRPAAWSPVRCRSPTSVAADLTVRPAADWSRSRGPSQLVLMPKRAQPLTVAIRLLLQDAPASVPVLAERIGKAGGTLRTLSTVRRVARNGTSAAELEIEVEGIDEDALVLAIDGLPGLLETSLTRSLDRG